MNMAPLLSTSDAGVERVLLVGVVQPRRNAGEVQDSLDELALLADTAGAEVVERIICRQPAPQAATYIGKGKAAALAEQCRAAGITTVVFDDDLSPAQDRNLEEIMQVKIIDRTQMILDIFARHARTREGALQIELAQLQYLLPRLKRRWTHLERQQGGIGMVGPGEKQLELDRRRIEIQISRIERELEQVRARRAEQRRGRRRHGWALLTLVGYTNAGKSTLLNILTGADVTACDQLFATLDPTTRQLELPNHQPALITDTVGFIRKLPHHLVESFKATLEEVVEADLLLHVVDVAHPQVDEQIRAVEQVLKELGCEAKPILAVLNKIDLPAADGQCERIARQLPRSVAVSALTGAGLDRLRAELSDWLKNRNLEVRLRIPAADGQMLAALKKCANVLTETLDGDVVCVTARVPASLLGKCAPYRVDEDSHE